MEGDVLMEYIISPMWVLLELVFTILFFDTFLPRTNIRHKKVLFLIVWVFISKYTLSGLPQIYCSILSVMVYFACSFLLFTGHWLWHFMLTLLSFSIMAVVDLCFSYGSCVLLGIDTNTLVAQRLLYTSVVTSGKLISVFGVWLCRRGKRDKYLMGAKVGWLLLSLLFPVVSCVIQFVILYYFRDNEELTTGGFVINCALGIANVGMLYLIQSVQRITMENQRMALLNQQKTIQVRSIEALEKSYRAQRAATHEYLHNLTAVHGLLAKGELAEAKSFVDSLIGNQTARIFAVDSMHPVVDVVLNQKYQQAKEKGIDIQIRVNNISGIGISTEYIVVLLSNLLDNAIEACERITSNRMILVSLIAEERLYISVRNTSNPVDVKDNEVISSKQPYEEHGYGLMNIKRIIDALHGEYAIQYKDGWFEFAAEVPTT